MNYALAIHGGAGTISKQHITPDKEKEYLAVLKEAVLFGASILKSGGSSLDVVEKTVIFLEDIPLFNAGKGSVFTHHGHHEMDASIMCGQTMQAGAVAAVRNVKNPVMLSRKVMDESGFVLLVGRGAEDFAHHCALDFREDEYFFTQYRYAQWQMLKNSEVAEVDHFDNNKYGTVGAVALDNNGNLAAATSTGGLTNKKFGRVGDTSVIGAGTYANNNTCAISCTGYGEYFIRNVVAHDVSALMEYKNMTLADATDVVVHHKLKKAGGEGGLIAIDRQGNICMPFNTQGMYRGCANAKSENIQVAIY
ncbi:MAG: isoaspartyl peptidase/L-asparaginase [Cytophagales bacterium]|nr:isoaspartyl peptidase/L-asparaginase [Cytophagales bacterium]